MAKKAEERFYNRHQVQNQVARAILAELGLIRRLLEEHIGGKE